MQYSLVFPCYNEIDNLEKLVSKCYHLNERGIETIIVDNGSTDNTGQFLNSIEKNQFFKHVTVKKNIGYGYGIKYGLAEATGNIIGWTHADLQTDPNDIFKAIDFIKKNRIKGRYFFKGKRYGRKIQDLIFTYFMQLIFSLVLNKKLEDINAQPNLFFREDLNLVLNGPNDFALDIYTYIEFKKLNYNIYRFDVAFSNRNAGVSKSSENIFMKLKTSLRFIKYLFKLKYNVDYTT